MKTTGRAVALAATVALVAPGCFRHGGHGFWTAMAIMTTAVVISRPPPPAPQVAYAPAGRPGYTWQPGYWTLEDDDWVWVEGRWIADYPGYRWEPSVWVADPNGHWRLLPGRWVATGPVEAPFPPPPPPRPYPSESGDRAKD